MQYLLDTHTFLWMAVSPEQLSKAVKDAVLKKNNRLYLSAASAWEVTLLWQLDRIVLPDQPQRFIPEAMQQMSIQPLPISFLTAISSAMLPLIHRDPFDRILIAEAVKENLTILTKDKKIAEYDVKTQW